ncbi:MAG: hypothetical protein LBM20_01025 [Rikenellaceae bacterium]|nr:hypothetical protein [Rikenellaceae bacterium]
MQEIITGIIVFVCVAVAVTAIVRWFRGRGSSCGCGDDSRTEANTCAGCALAESCRKQEKERDC